MPLKVDSEKLAECLKKKLTRWYEKYHNLTGNKPKDEIPYPPNISVEEFNEISFFKNLVLYFIENKVFSEKEFNSICNEVGITETNLITFERIGERRIIEPQHVTISFPL